MILAEKVYKLIHSPELELNRKEGLELLNHLNTHFSDWIFEVVITPNKLTFKLK